jgi:sec-independent protein translocase protein TatC
VKNPRTHPKNRSRKQHPKESDVKTFVEHVQELRNRLFWVVIVFIIASAVAYPFFDKILAALVQPLGNQQLYYLTPSGGFSFILKVCMYAGIVGAVPVMIYQLFCYIQPIMGKVKYRTVLAYIVASILLAAAGIALAYFVSLPAALHFLTDFNFSQISAMLTADSYFSFVMTYLLAAALLFQLPLVLMIFNSVTPLSPGGMMKYQRYVIVIAFILGAIISPTPDALNQALLAGPIIGMYQLSIFLIMIQNAVRRKRQPASAIASMPTRELTDRRVTAPASQLLAQPPAALYEMVPKSAQPTKVFFSDVLSPPRSRSRIVSPPRPLRPPSRPMMSRSHKGTYTRSIDGFAIDA